jgi:dipeptidyl aminopeptidase/acylaminoacyl peptidase
MKAYYRAAAVLITTALAAVPAAAAKLPRPTTPEDIVRIAYVSTAVASHRGDRVAFVVTKLDPARNRYARNIWVVDANGGGLRQLTRGDGDSDPQWSPDDRTIAFAGARGAPSQIYTIELDGGEARKLTHEEKGAFGPRWSHDGTRILYGATFQDAQPKTQLDEKAAGGALDEKHKMSDVRTTDRLDFEVNGEGETFARHTHLLTMRADGSARKQITPLSPWSESSAAWSYDDRLIAFVSLRRPVDPERVDVYLVASGGGTPHRVPAKHRTSGAPVIARDRSGIYYTVASHADPAGLPGVARLDGSGEHVIVPENTVALGNFVLTDQREAGAGCGPLLEPHGRWFLAEVSVPGATVLQRFDTTTGRASNVVARGDEIVDCSANDALTTIAYTASDASHPAEVYVYDAARGVTPADALQRRVRREHASGSGAALHRARRPRLPGARMVLAGERPARDARADAARDPRRPERGVRELVLPGDADARGARLQRRGREPTRQRRVRLRVRGGALEELGRPDVP